MFITELGKRMDEQSENFKEDKKNISKYQAEVTELKYNT